MAAVTGTDERRRSRQAEFLQVAAELFARRGYAGTSVDDLGAALGVSGPAVYWHFASKEALLVEMLSSVSERLLDGGERCLRDASGPRDALERLVSWQVTFALEHPELIVVHERELAHVPEPARHRIRRTQRLYVELWVDSLGALAPSVPAARRRAAVHAAIGLINATPHVREHLARQALSALLEAMALSALGAALEEPADG